MPEHRSLLRSRFPCEAPRHSEIGDDLAAVREWISALSARSDTGRRYDVVLGQVGGRHIGRNSLPSRVVVSTMDQAWSLLDVRREVDRFGELLELAAETPAVRIRVSPSLGLPAPISELALRVTELRELAGPPGDVIADAPDRGRTRPLHRSRHRSAGPTGAPRAGASRLGGCDNRPRAGSARRARVRHEKTDDDFSSGGGLVATAFSAEAARCRANPTGSGVSEPWTSCRPSPNRNRGRPVDSSGKSRLRSLQIVDSKSGKR